MVSCQKGSTCHAYARQIGPFWQDTIDVREHQSVSKIVDLGDDLYMFPIRFQWPSWTTLEDATKIKPNWLYGASGQ